MNDPYPRTQPNIIATGMTMQPKLSHIDELLATQIALREHLSELSRDADGIPRCAACERSDNLRSIGPGVFACADCMAEEPAEWVSIDDGRGMPRPWEAQPVHTESTSSEGLFASSSDFDGRTARHRVRR